MKRWNAILMVLAATMIWGSANSINKLALNYGSPSGVLLVQLSASVAFLAVVGLLLRLRIQELRNAFSLWWTGILEPGLTYIFGITGLQTSNASVASIILSFEAALVVIIVWSLGYESPSRRFWALSALSFSGVCLVVLGGIGFESGGSLVGAFFIFLATLSASLYAVTSARLLSHQNPLAVVIVQQAVSLMVVVLYSLLTDFPKGSECSFCFTRTQFAWIALSGIAQYAIGFLLFVASLKTLSAAVSSAYLNAIPLFGVAVAAVVLGERMSALQWIGSATAIAALVLISLLKGEGESNDIKAPRL